MKKTWMPFLLAAALCSSSAWARDSVATYSVDSALQSETGKVGDDIALYFAGQPHPRVVKEFGAVATNKKTNAFNKSDLQACQHVFLSAVIALQEQARRQGGNAVVNIKSNYKNTLTESPTEFTCGAGAVIAGVALVGDVVTIQK